MEMLSTLDIEDMTPKQLRKMLSGIARSKLPHHKKSEEEQEKYKAEAEDENSSLVELDREKGDSKPPKVNKDDLPKAAKEDEEEDEEDTKKKKDD